MENPERFVEVIWLDTVSENGWTQEVSKFPKMAEITQRGWLIEDTDTYVLMCSAVQTNTKPDEFMFGDVTIIPAGCIVSMEDV